MNNNDERLKQILIEKSKNGYAIISIYNPDTTVKNRRNSKKARWLREQIIDAGFQYKPVTCTLSGNETKHDFIVFEKFDDGFTDTGIKLNEFLEDCKSRNWCKTLTVQYNIEDYLKDKEFEHPILKSQKEQFHNRNEIILEDLFEPPEQINGWGIYRVFSETSIMYHCGDILCAISLAPNGTWTRHYGMIKPVGASIKKEIGLTKEQAFSNLSIKRR